MITKIYAAFWIAVAILAGLTYLTIGFSMFTALVFGFICFGLVFMGMMSVLPSMVGHDSPSENIKWPKTRQANEVKDIVMDSIPRFQSWTSTHSRAIAKPKFR